jgi:hypothetical protein
MTSEQGVVTVFKTAGFTNDPEKMNIRTMDCMDCHNRPAHRFKSPESAVNLAMALGHIDRSLPFIKTNAMAALLGPYASESGALEGIATTLSDRYHQDPRIGPTIDAVQEIYTNNFFPKMKANWRVYPDNIGHKDWPGCFRCHDGQHKTPDGLRSIKANDCNTCHVILAQGTAAQMNQLTPLGQKFAHPIDEYDPAFQCTDCHTGGL